jgi:hypothetical protein
MAGSKMPKEFKDVVRQIEVKESIYCTLPDFDPVFYSFGCPIGHQTCGELEEILKDYSDKNVFVAIPYTDYTGEETIIELLTVAGLVPKLAKQKIETKVILCKICREIRKSCFGIADISMNNVNVAYELGLMQSLGRNCAILLEEGKKPQSDLQGLEDVLYKDLHQLNQKLGGWLKDNISVANKKAINQHIKNKSS